MPDLRCMLSRGWTRPDAPVAEIAMLIWTICAGIVQTYIANPSKRGVSLAIFNWTRQVGVVVVVAGRLRRCVGTVWWQWMG